MLDSFRDKSVQLTLLIFALFVAAHLLGIGPLDSVWSLSHWSATPVVGIIIWAITTAIFGFLIIRLAAKKITSPAWLHWLIVPVFVAVAVLLRFDSFVYGGGNLRIAEFTDSSRIIYRWFELGSIAVAGKLFHSLRAMEVPTREAAVNGWMIWSLVMATVSAIGAVKLSSLLTQSMVKRCFLALLVLFGGHSLVLFGYTGVEASIPTAVIWFAVAAAGYSIRRSLGWLGLCWGIAAVGLLFHVSLLMLLPGCVYLTAQHFGGKKQTRVPWFAALFTLVALVIGVYVQAAKSLELRSVILLFESKRPFADYGIFSPRHLLDWLQLVLLGAPTMIVAGYLYVTRAISRERMPMVGAMAVTAISGLVAMLILDPYHSVVLDTPRLLSYLAPVGVVLAMLLSDKQKDAPANDNALPYLAVTSLSLLLAILPVYHSIAAADKYALPYLDKHNVYHPTATMSFRDAYFHRKQIDEARNWEDNLVVKSTDYFLLRGTVILRENGSYAAAAEEQTKIVTKFPYWAEPRAALAVNLMTLGQYVAAKPHIDTCLMLKPYEKRHLMNLYSYSRDIQDWPNAVQQVARAEELFPGDVDIRTDRMLIFYRANDFVAAQVMADELLAQDSLLPFPYLVKGLLEDRNRNVAKAIPMYEKFVKLAPKEPETPKIQQRLDSLKAAVPR